MSFWKCVRVCKSKHCYEPRGERPSYDSNNETQNNESNVDLKIKVSVSDILLT